MKTQLIGGSLARVLIACGVLGGTGQQVAFAQSEASTDQAVDVVVVTAQRREERLQDVPISIVSLSGAKLDEAADPGMFDSLKRVPGVGMTQGSQNGGSQISVRGVGAAAALFGGASPVGYYLDAVPFAFVKSSIIPDVSGYDLDRVEVLRGPQGTLYGASSQAGVVRVLTKDADLSDWEFKVRGATSVTNDGGGNYRGDLAVNAPIITDKLAVRAVLGYQDLSGWIDRPTKEDANSSQLTNVRLKVNAQPTENLSLGASVWSSRSDYDQSSIGTPDRKRDDPTNEPGSDDYDAYGFKAVYTLPWASVTSSTGYIDYTGENIRDMAQGTVAPPALTTNLHDKVFSEEINITSTHAGPWRWSLGGMYRDAQDEFFQTINDIDGNTLYNFLARQRYASKSYAVFGEVTRTLFDERLEVTGGLRYFTDDVKFQEIQNFAGLPLIQQDDSFDKVSPRAVLSWHATSETNAYASYSEGFRSGSLQSAGVLRAAPNIGPIAPDNLKTYEVGTKNSLLGGDLYVEGAVYYQEWEDVQQPLSVLYNGVPLSAVVNGPGASGIGYEIGLTVKPMSDLTISLGFGQNDLTQDSDVISGTVVLFNKGDRLSYSPKTTASGSVDYWFALGGGFEGQFSASASYTSQQETRQLSGTTVQLLPGEDFLDVGARFTVDSGEGWEVSLFGTNLTDNDHVPILGSPLADSSLPRPRTIGIQFDYNM